MKVRSLFLSAVIGLTMMYAADAGAITAMEVSAAESEHIELSDDIYDFQIKIGDEIYQFPMSYEEFTAKGWTIAVDTDPEEKLSSNHYDIVTFYRGKDKVSAYVVNFKINEASIKECLVGGISLDGQYYFDLETTSVELAGGIAAGSASEEDIIAAYGIPSNIYEGELYTKLSYELEYKQSVELYVFKDENVLKEIELENFVQPEGFDIGTVSTETPERVLAYTAPPELSATVLESQVKYCGDLYTLPAPVSAFIENGWELLDMTEESFLTGGGGTYVYMMRDNQKEGFYISNYEEYAVTPENGFIEALDVSDYTSDYFSLEVSGNLTLGMNKSAFIAAAEENGYLYDEETDSLDIYKSVDTRYDTCLNVEFTDDVATYIEYENTTLNDN